MRLYPPQNLILYREIDQIHSSTDSSSTTISQLSIATPIGEMLAPYKEQCAQKLDEHISAYISWLDPENPKQSIQAQMPWYLRWFDPTSRKHRIIVGTTVAIGTIGITVSSAHGLWLLYKWVRPS